MPYPSCAVLWSPLPRLTHVLRFAGHVGITDSAGNSYDFGGDYIVGVNHMTFGEPTKAYSFLPSLPEGHLGPWDRGVKRAAEEYRKMRYNFFSNNCHSFVKRCLELIDEEFQADSATKGVHVAQYSVTGIAFKLRPKMEPLKPAHEIEPKPK